MLYIVFDVNHEVVIETYNMNEALANWNPRLGHTVRTYTIEEQEKIGRAGYNCSDFADKKALQNLIEA